MWPPQKWAWSISFCARFARVNSNFYSVPVSPLINLATMAGLVWEGLDCVGFVYKIVEITAVGSNNGGGRVVGLSVCMGRNGAGSNLAVHFDFFFFFPCRIFLSVDRSHLR